MGVFLCYNVSMTTDYLTPSEAALRLWKAGLSVTVRTVQRWCASGRLDAEKKGGGQRGIWLIDPASVEAVIQEEMEKEISYVES